MRSDEIPMLDLATLGLPARPRVLEVRPEPVIDEYGKPALDVWVIVDEDTPDEELIYPNTLPVTDAIQNALDAMNDERFSFVWFRKPSELQRPCGKRRRRGKC